jgi:hypothetical protein
MRPWPRKSVLTIALLLGAAAIARAQEVGSRRPDPIAPSDTASIEKPAAPDEEAFPVVLGSFTTTLAGSRPERTANVRLAVDALDGLVLEPGQVLSFDAVVGPRSLERGYQPAPVILHETRQLQTGGGVCQVASTLFVAGLLSGLSSVERSRHSSPVDYIALGEDATIAWGAKDLKIRNDTGQRVRLRMFVRGATLNARFEGEETSPDSFELATEERELPAEPGVEGARPGREIELYRVRTGRRGGQSRELVHRDLYPPTRGASATP